MAHKAESAGRTLRSRRVHATEKSPKPPYRREKKEEEGEEKIHAG
jgi:hypothetical protein